MLTPGGDSSGGDLTEGEEKPSMPKHGLGDQTLRCRDNQKEMGFPPSWKKQVVQGLFPFKLFPLYPAASVLSLQSRRRGWGDRSPQHTAPDRVWATVHEGGSAGGETRVPFLPYSRVSLNPHLQEPCHQHPPPYRLLSRGQGLEDECFETSKI